MAGNILMRLAMDQITVLLGAEPKLAQAFERLQNGRPIPISRNSARKA